MVDRLTRSHSYRLYQKFLSPIAVHPNPQRHFPTQWSRTLQPLSPHPNLVSYVMLHRQLSSIPFLRRACRSPSSAVPLEMMGTECGRRFLHVEKRLEELGLELPPPAPPRANYNSVCWSSGNTILYVSGHLPFNTAGTELTKGRIGEGGRDVAYGYQAARQVGLGLVSTLKDQLGDLDRVEQVVKASKWDWWWFFVSVFPHVWGSFRQCG